MILWHILRCSSYFRAGICRSGDVWPAVTPLRPAKVKVFLIVTYLMLYCMLYCHLLFKFRTNMAVCLIYCNTKPIEAFTFVYTQVSNDLLSFNSVFLSSFFLSHSSSPSSFRTTQVRARWVCWCGWWRQLGKTTIKSSNVLIVQPDTL